MPDRLIEQLDGAGEIIPKGQGEPLAVRYRIEVRQRMIPAGPGEHIPGLKHIEGVVTHPSDSLFGIRMVGKYFTLVLSDGRKLDFFFRDQEGSIANSGPGCTSDRTHDGQSQSIE